MPWWQTQRSNRTVLEGLYILERVAVRAHTRRQAPMTTTVRSDMEGVKTRYRGRMPLADDPVLGAARFFINTDPNVEDRLPRLSIE